MAKVKKIYFCTNCGNETQSWVGKCPSCGEWNSLKEELSVEPKGSLLQNRKMFGAQRGGKELSAKPLTLDQIEQGDVCRLDMGYEEVNRVLGGGVVKGSLVLIGGEPGIGKSTLSLQMALSSKDIKTLYVSGEESPQQIKLRAERLGYENQNCYILAETNLDLIFPHIEAIEPDIIVIDSIQTLFTESIDSSAGGISQIRECAAMLLRYAKSSQVPVFIIGHITKDGTIAGPKILEHIVDVVIQFEGDNNNIYRLLRGIKNRFGSTSEIGVFEMRGNGLAEVKDTSDILVSHHDEPLSGIAIGSTMDGARSFLIEVQALVGTATYGTPQRTTTGFDVKRLNMLLAVIEKRLNFKVSTKDIFLNIAGGIKVSDPGLDMSVVVAILSSYLDREISSDVTFCGEIGLSGEVRPASRTEARIMEASRLGYKRIVVSSYAKKGLTKDKFPIDVQFVSKIEELARILVN